MNFGFDIDGTITDAPDALGTIMRALRAAGHEVHVITGTMDAPLTEQNTADRVAQLRSLGLGDAYDALHVISFPEVGAAGKADYCQEHSIALMFEDSEVYAEAIGKVCPVVLLLP